MERGQDDTGIFSSAASVFPSSNGQLRVDGSAQSTLRVWVLGRQPGVYSQTRAGIELVCLP